MKNNEKQTVRWILLILSCIMSISIYIRYNIPNYSHEVFGVTYMTMNNPFYEVIDNQLEKVIEANGDQLITLDPSLDIDKQIEQIRSFIAQRVSGIFVNPVDSQAIVPVLKDAKAAGIPVIVLDTEIDEPGLADCTIVSDNYNAVVQCALDMMERKQQADIILLRHSKVLSAAQRIQGFLDTIEGKPDYRVIDEAECEGQLELAMPVMMEMLAGNDHVEVVMALNDPSALGAMAALEQYGIHDAMVYGIDGTPDFKALIGENPMASGTVAQSPISIGTTAAELMYDRLAGKQIESRVVVPVYLINPDNMNSYSKTGWQ